MSSKDTQQSGRFHPIVLSPPDPYAPLPEVCSEHQVERDWALECRLPDGRTRKQLEEQLSSSAGPTPTECIHETRDESILHVHLPESTLDQIPDVSSTSSENPSLWIEVKQTIERYRRSHQLEFPESGTLVLSGRPALMGVLNVTPDSFSDGGNYVTPEAAEQRARQMENEGASMIDVGGESTRPGADPVPLDEEKQRVIPVIERLSRTLSVPISIDTQKPEVAREALQAGAEMINDVGGLQREPELLHIAREHSVPAVAMHMQGTPRTMQEDPSYEHVLRDICRYLRTSRQSAVSHQFPERQLVLDPGIGFGKSQEHNLTILRNVHRFRSLGCPLLLGPSRKSFIGNVLNTPVDERVEGTAAAVAGPALRGTNLFRVHDVQAMYRFLKVLWAIHRPSTWQDDLLHSKRETHVVE